MPFTVEEVRDFTSTLLNEVQQCENGEGVECATLDAALEHHAQICCRYLTAVREWAREVFSGKIDFDPEVERIWREQGSVLHFFAWELSQCGEQAEIPCYELIGQTRLKAAMWDIEHLLKGWVSPKRSIGPSARIGLPANTPAQSDEIRRRINSLPQLPADWKPTKRWQRFLFRASKRKAY